MTKLETGIYLVFWHDVLQRVNKTSQKLQSYDIDLNTSIELLKSLRSYVESLRNNFNNYETLGKKNIGVRRVRPATKASTQT